MGFFCCFFYIFFFLNFNYEERTLDQCRASPAVLKEGMESLMLPVFRIKNCCVVSLLFLEDLKTECFVLQCS